MSFAMAYAAQRVPYYMLIKETVLLVIVFSQLVDGIMSRYLAMQLRETFVRKNRTPRPNFSSYFRFFPKGKNFYCFKMIYMLRNMKKINKFFFQLCPPPLIPLPKCIRTEKPYCERLKRKKQAPGIIQNPFHYM